MTEPILAVTDFSDPGLKLARELREENVPLEATIGDAKLDCDSCLLVAGGLKICGIIPISVMWGLDTSGGI